MLKNLFSDESRSILDRLLNRPKLPSGFRHRSFGTEFEGAKGALDKIEITAEHLEDILGPDEKRRVACITFLRSFQKGARPRRDRKFRKLERALIARVREPIDETTWAVLGVLRMLHVGKKFTLDELRAFLSSEDERLFPSAVAMMGEHGLAAQEELTLLTMSEDRLIAQWAAAALGIAMKPAPLSADNIKRRLFGFLDGASPESYYLLNKPSRPSLALKMSM